MIRPSAGVDHHGAAPLRRRLPPPPAQRPLRRPAASPCCTTAASPRSPRPRCRVESPRPAAARPASPAPNAAPNASPAPRPLTTGTASPGTRSSPPSRVRADDPVRAVFGHRHPRAELERIGRRRARPPETRCRRRSRCRPAGRRSAPARGTRATRSPHRLGSPIQIEDGERSADPCAPGCPAPSSGWARAPVQCRSRRPAAPPPARPSACPAARSSQSGHVGSR